MSTATDPRGRRTRGPTEVSEFKSLFLPIKDDEEVIFADFFTPLTIGKATAGQENGGASTKGSPMFSPAEGATPQSISSRSSISAPQDNTPSALFSLLSSRAEQVLCVLSTGEIVLFDLSSSSRGPTVRNRLPPPGGPGTVATAAALAPLQISIACRPAGSSIRPPTGVDNQPASKSPGRHPSYSSMAYQDAPGNIALVASANRAGSARGGDTPLPSAVNLVRGVVGTSSGRVEVFTDEGYVFGFQAHPCAILFVSIVFTDPSSGDGASDVSGLTSTLQPVSITSSSAASATGSSLTCFLTEHLGFATMGSDGIAYLWKRRSNSTLVPHAIIDKSLFSFRTQCICVHQPCVKDALLNWTDTLLASVVLHTTPGLSKELRTRSGVTLEDVEPPITLPSAFSKANAITTNGEIVVLARGSTLYCITLANSTCKCVLEADSSITTALISGPAVIVASDKGTVYVINILSLTLLARYYTFSNTAVRSLFFHGPAALMIIVDDTGTAELVQLPEETFTDLTRYENSWDETHVTSADVLRLLVQLESRPMDMEEASASTVVADRSVRQEWVESLVLARLKVPEDITTYMRANMFIM